MTRVVLATHNTHKVAELRQILAGLPGLEGLEIVGAGEVGAPSPVEDGVSFAENALLKARATAAATGLPALADDSGLAVDVLGGAPGIFSARWAGGHGDDAANLALLLDQLADVRDEHRGAQFVCAAALVTPDGDEHVETGVLRGRLTRAPRGSGGFGYDPILEPDAQPARAQGRPLTSAELTPQEKNAVSHRGHAFRAMAPHLARLLG
ncbi:RdgB/HAM1 family non-canonical purine NTP pyrophosphatase [Actinotalea sp.]|uniref:RdgB/HAM1 family non-canonical purine NTP pyrophosphatase n=1 Tax=Actinotalea sp. TaxID=1872145 RepID=UPI00356A4409